MEDLRPGLIQDIGADEQVAFGTPPDSGDFDPFSRAILRAAAAGLGLTYEAFTGDLSTVNFSSARMGRIEMDRNVSGWQHKMLIPALLQPLSRWITPCCGRALSPRPPCALAKSTSPAPLPRRSPPLRLTPREIEDRLEEAAYTFRNLPEKDRPRGYGRSWPPVVHDANRPDPSNFGRDTFPGFDA